MLRGACYELRGVGLWIWDFGFRIWDCLKGYFLIYISELVKAENIRLQASTLEREYGPAGMAQGVRSRVRWFEQYNPITNQL